MEKNCKYLCEDCWASWQKKDYPGNAMFSDGLACPNCESRNIVVIELESNNYRIYEKNYSAL